MNFFFFHVSLSFQKLMAPWLRRMPTSDGHQTCFNQTALVLQIMTDPMPTCIRSKILPHLKGVMSILDDVNQCAFDSWIHKKIWSVSIFHHLQSIQMLIDRLIHRTQCKIFWLDWLFFRPIRTRRLKERFKNFYDFCQSIKPILREYHTQGSLTQTEASSMMGQWNQNQYALNAWQGQFYQLSQQHQALLNQHHGLLESIDQSLHFLKK